MNEPDLFTVYYINGRSVVYHSNPRCPTLIRQGYGVWPAQEGILQPDGNIAAWINHQPAAITRRPCKRCHRA